MRCDVSSLRGAQGQAGGGAAAAIDFEDPPSGLGQAAEAQGVGAEAEQEIGGGQQQQLEQQESAVQWVPPPAPPPPEQEVVYLRYQVPQDREEQMARLFRLLQVTGGGGEGTAV